MLLGDVTNDSMIIISFLSPMSISNSSWKRGFGKYSRLSRLFSRILHMGKNWRIRHGGNLREKRLAIDFFLLKISAEITTKVMKTWCTYSLSSRSTYSLSRVRANYDTFNIRYIGATIWNSIDTYIYCTYLLIPFDLLINLLSMRSKL